MFPMRADTTAYDAGLAKAEAIMREFVCETCGGPVERLVQDVRQTGVRDNYIYWEKDGDPHTFCKEHTRLSKATYLDGRVEINAPIEE